MFNIEPVTGDRVDGFRHSLRQRIARFGSMAGLPRRARKAEANAKEKAKAPEGVPIWQK